MYITVKVPDNTARLFYAEVENCYEMESKPVTMGMIVKVEKEFEISDTIRPVLVCDGEKEATS